MLQHNYSGDPPYRFSQFCKRVPLQGSVALYNALTLKTLFVDVVALKTLESFETGCTLPAFSQRTIKEGNEYHQAINELVGRMIELNMLLPVQANELDDLRLLRETCMAKPEITGAYIMLTDKCNFACRYCFVEHPLPKTHAFSMMSPDTAREAIDRFAKWSEPNYVRSIIFCGGEPLLNLAALRVGLERIDEHVAQGTLTDQLKLQLITNGSLVDQSVAELAKAHDLKVSVSIDGMPEYHDKERIGRNGKGTFAETIRGYNLLKAAGVTVGVSLTISRSLQGHLLENVLWLVDALGVKSLGFNTLMDIDPSNRVPVEYAEAVNCEMIDCFKVLRARGIYEDRIMRKVESFIEGTPYLHDCSGCGHQIVVAPDGRVGVCHGYAGWQKYFVMPDEHFDPREHPYWREWLSRSPISMPQCFNCEALGICGGGCGCSADVRNGSIWSVNETFCVHSKMVLRWMLQDLLDRSLKVVS